MTGIPRPRDSGGGVVLGMFRVSVVVRGLEPLLVWDDALVDDVVKRLAV